MTADGSTQIVARNFFYLSVSTVLGKALGFLAVVRVVRALGPEGFGLIAVAMAVANHLVTFTCSGLDALGAREIAAGRLSPRSVGSLLFSKLVFSAAVYALLWIVVRWIDPGPEVARVISLYGLLLFTESLSLSFVFQGRERMLTVAVAGVLQQLVFLALVWVAVMDPSHAARVPLAQLAAETTAVFVLAVGFLRLPDAGPLDLRPRAPLRLLARALPMSASRFLRQAMYEADTILLGAIAGTRSAGIYSSAARLVSLFWTIFDRFQYVVFPTVTRNNEKAPETTRRGIVLVSLGVFASSLVVAAVLGLAAPMLVPLVYGEAFAAAIAPLQLLSWALPIAATAAVYRVGLLVFDRLRLDMMILCAAVAINLTLNLLWIPSLGVRGAVLATLASEAAALLMVFWASRYWRLPSPVPDLGRHPEGEDPCLDR